MCVTERCISSSTPFTDVFLSFIILAILVLDMFPFYANTSQKDFSLKL